MVVVVDAADAGRDAAVAVAVLAPPRHRGTAVFTAVNSAAGQGLEAVGPSNRFGPAVPPHRSSAAPIRVPFRGPSDERERIVLFLLSPLFFIPLPLRSQRASRPRRRPSASVRVRARTTERAGL